MSSTQEHFAHFALTAFSFLPVVFHRWRVFLFVWLLLVCCFSWTTRTKANSPSSSCSSSSWFELNNSLALVMNFLWHCQKGWENQRYVSLLQNIIMTIFLKRESEVQLKAQNVTQTCRSPPLSVEGDSNLSFYWSDKKHASAYMSVCETTLMTHCCTWLLQAKSSASLCGGSPTWLQLNPSVFSGLVQPTVVLPLREIIYTHKRWNAMRHADNQWG